MSEVWILLGIVGNVILFVWGVLYLTKAILYLAKAIKDINNTNGL